MAQINHLLRLKWINMNGRQASSFYRFYANKPCPKHSSTQIESNATASKQADVSPHHTDQCDDAKKSLGAAQQHNNTTKSNSVDNVQKDIRGYVVERAFNFMHKFESKLEQRFPQAVKISRQFTNGFRTFLGDFVSYTRIYKETRLGDMELDKLSRKDLELYYRMPSECRKLVPFLVVAALPFAQYVMLPIAYKWPRFWLTRHFWSPEQRDENAVMDIKRRISQNRAIFRALQAKLPMIESSEHYALWSGVLAKLGSGQHPTVDEIIATKPIFAVSPYIHRSLANPHVNDLCVLHGIGWFRKRSTLAYRTMMVILMDRAIAHEGGVQQLTADELRTACFMRGLNASGLSEDELKRWLDHWIQITEHVKSREHLSLFLHLPILLAYNHPNNWKLIYTERQ